MINKKCASLQYMSARTNEQIEKSVEELRYINQVNNQQALVMTTVDPNPQSLIFDGREEHSFRVALYIINKRQLEESVIEVLQGNKGKSMLPDEIGDHINFNGLNFDSTIKSILEHLEKKEVVCRFPNAMGYSII